MNDVVQKFVDFMNANSGEGQPKSTDVEIAREGSKIVLPAEPKVMSEREAITHLQRKIEEGETTVAVHEEVDAFPLEGAYGFMQVLREIYGWATPVPEKTFFGEKPPVTLSLEVGPGEFTQVIWGQFQIPGIDGLLATGATRKPNGDWIFVIQGTVKKKFSETVKLIAKKVREHVRTKSIYKGKAIKITTDSSGNLKPEAAPSFLDLSKVNPEELILPGHVEVQVKTSLFTPIEKTAECRKYGVPLKMGVLLEGPYGTGKTLTAFVTAAKAQANGWTFIYLDRVTGLKDAYNFAKRYSPAVIFAEDIDRVISGNRDVSKDDILNTIDGVDAKGAEIITVLTTNEVEKINKAMMRPGRLDAVVSFEPLDEGAAQRLVRLYARGLIAETEDLTEAGKELKGQIPALIREVVERSKRYAIGHSNGEGTLQISGRDVANAARSMKRHMELLKEKKNVISAEERFGKEFGKFLDHATTVASYDLVGEDDSEEQKAS